MTPIGNLINTKDIGPLNKTLIYLDDMDLKKLSFVMSSSKREMDKNYEEFRALKLMGKKIETTKFDPKYLSFYKFIHEINLFVDSITTPLKLSEKEKKYILDHRRESIHSNQNDLFNIRFGIEIGEKINKSLITTIFIRDKLSMIDIIEVLVETYSDLSYVSTMLPMKTIATVIDSDEHYHKLLKLYKIFGMSFIMDIIEYFDLEYFFKKFMISTLCYSKYVNRYMDILEEDSSYHIHDETINDMIKEGSDLRSLCDALIKEYPDMYSLQSSYKNNYGTERVISGFEEVFRWIDIAIADTEYLKDYQEGLDKYETLHYK